MRINRFQILSLSLIIQLVIPTFFISAQSNNKDSVKSPKLEKEIEKNLMYSKLIQQLENRYFVFESEFGQGSDMTFVVVDSLYGEVQNGNRNNLQGRITQYEIRKNDKKRTVSVSIKMRAEMYTADVFLFIGTYGNGYATVKSDFPGNFSFDGNIIDLDNATYYSGPSHFVH
ncbi:MAG: hypothetical protein K9H49_15655 [Bacteroidales bacterium]|nr:hypothetical protein [Bacteroidales bacterium]MCF8391044.1 hypothetical protein [Bacteroidales bacterium]